MAQSLKAGAAGYATKNVRHEELVAAIREVHAGGQPLDPTVREAPASPGANGLLTDRELEVLGLMGEGFTNTEIGRLIGTSTRTAKAHVAAIIEKLHVVDRTQAVARLIHSACSAPRPPARSRVGPDGTAWHRAGSPRREPKGIRPQFHRRSNRSAHALGSSSAFTAGSRTWAVIVVPEPGELSICSVPPSRSSRSRIPWRPKCPGRGPPPCRGGSRHRRREP